MRTKGVWKMSNAWVLATIVVIDVLFVFYLAAILELFISTSAYSSWLYRQCLTE